MSSVAVNPPKTPVTKGSNGIATATLPNVCKMPGPPAPFVPTPLPNIGKSGDSPQGYSTTVKIEGQPVGIQGASFGSMGDVASKGTGGGIVSNNVEGPTKFLAPGSLNVKIEGKNVQYLGDQMLNNCGPGGSPANSATLEGLLQPPLVALATDGGNNPLEIKCKDAPASSKEKFSDCEKAEICMKCADINEQAKAGKLKRRSTAAQEAARCKGDRAAARQRTIDTELLLCSLDPNDFSDYFTHPCAHEAWAKSRPSDFDGFDPDHIHEIQLGGHPTDVTNLRWMSSRTNRWIGRTLAEYNKSEQHTGVKPDCCEGI